jgi:hypothetical protein
MKLVRIESKNKQVYINSDHIVSLEPLCRPFDDEFGIPCTHIVSVYGDQDYRITHKCFENILQILGWVS